MNSDAFQPCRAGAFLPDQIVHGPSVGTSDGIAGCFEGSKLNAITWPVGMCCSMWQWKIHVPGFSTLKRMTSQLLRKMLTMSFSMGSFKFCVLMSFAGSYGQPQY